MQELIQSLCWLSFRALIHRSCKSELICCGFVMHPFRTSSWMQAKTPNTSSITLFYLLSHSDLLKISQLNLTCQQNQSQSINIDNSSSSG